LGLGFLGLVEVGCVEEGNDGVDDDVERFEGGSKDGCGGSTGVPMSLFVVDDFKFRGADEEVSSGGERVSVLFSLSSVMISMDSLSQSSLSSSPLLRESSFTFSLLLIFCFCFRFEVDGDGFAGDADFPVPRLRLSEADVMVVGVLEVMVVVSAEIVRADVGKNGVCCFDLLAAFIVSCMDFNCSLGNWPFVDNDNDEEKGVLVNAVIVFDLGMLC
jgi:hypothetical protein